MLFDRAYSTSGDNLSRMRAVGKGDPVSRNGGKHGHHMPFLRRVASHVGGKRLKVRYEWRKAAASLGGKDVTSATPALTRRGESVEWRRNSLCRF